MKSTHLFKAFAILAGAFAILPFVSALGLAQEQLPWGESRDPEVVTPQDGSRYPGPQSQQNPLPPGQGTTRPYDRYPQRSYENGSSRDQDQPRDYGGTEYRDSPPYGDERYGNGRRYGEPNYPPPRYSEPYSSDEIMNAGHRFFGNVSSALAKVIEYAFSNYGRPNGYILGEGAGGAFVAGVQYGEGVLYTKDAGDHRVYWQGPSVGYDFGADGSKTMILVYNLHHPSDIYKTFSGVAGSAYLVGGVSLNIQKRDHVTLAPIRSGVGLRLGANVGYLKYTRQPTWNPF